jgi:tetratricopeptide (TPR) repeat protein
MTQSPLAMLDQEELLQLAITSGRRNDASATLSYLKEAVSRPDAGAKAYFLLGAEYAEINLYERAIANMEIALALDPSLHIARFQLGLLVLSCGEGVKAEVILQPLCTESSPLSDFAKGLIELMHDQFQLALDWFEQGMSQNSKKTSSAL